VRRLHFFIEFECKRSSDTIRHSICDLTCVTHIQFSSKERFTASVYKCANHVEHIGYMLQSGKQRSIL